MPVLYTLLGIILLIIILFSVRVHLIVDYGEYTKVSVKYLFLKIPIVDTSKPKKEKAKKQKKPKKEKEEKPAEETKETTEKQEKPKTKQEGNGLLKQLYVDQGYEGIEKMLRAVGNSLGGFFGKLYKTFVFDELYITMVTSGSDAADTAMKYGKLCSWLYPVLGKLVSTSKVKKYDFDISPDFLATKNEAEMYVHLHFTPIAITNAAIVLALKLVFKVLIKIIFAKKKSDKTKVVINADAEGENAGSEAKVNDKSNKTNINKDGASQ